MIEAFVLLFVAGNFILQFTWFLWSYDIHNRKHFTDDPKKEIELYDRIMDYVDKEFERRDKEKDKEKTRLFGERFFEPELKTPEEILNAERKHNPDEVTGMFDSVFKETK